jgi:pimeloyl-ACP methyl ester carboxylesterase
MPKKFLLAALLLLIWAAGAWAAPCAGEDFEIRVSGRAECLLMRRYGTVTPAVLVVWLHGNMTGGGPANYHFPIAQKAAADFAADKVLSVALVRPGYPDGSGQASTGNAYGRDENWDAANILEVGEAIARLRQKFQPQRVIIIGHSGGAATAAVLLGMKPQLADAAILVGCPCDLFAWPRMRGRRCRSEDPSEWVDKISPAARVIALTGELDDVTPPWLAQKYIEKLQARGIAAAFQLIPGVGHREALQSAAVSAALASLIHGNSRPLTRRNP